MIQGFINAKLASCRTQKLGHTEQSKMQKTREFANLFCEKLNQIKSVSLPLYLNKSVIEKGMNLGNGANNAIAVSLRQLISAENLETFTDASMELSYAMENEGVLLKIIPTFNGFVLLTGEISAIFDSGGVRIIESLDFSKNIPSEAFSLFPSKFDFTPEIVILRESAMNNAYFDEFILLQSNIFTRVNFPDIPQQRAIDIRNKILSADSNENALELVRSHSNNREYQLGVVLSFMRKALQPYRELEKPGFSKAIDDAYLYGLIVHELHHLLEKIYFHDIINISNYLFTNEARTFREFTAVLASLGYSRSLFLDMFEISGVAANRNIALNSTSPAQVSAMGNIFYEMLDYFGSADNLMTANAETIRDYSRSRLSRFYRDNFNLDFFYTERFRTQEMADDIIKVLRP